MIFIKNEKEIEKMRAASQIVVEVLKKLEMHAKPGITTFELNKLAEDIVKKRGVMSAFKGYSNYPASVCFAVNEEVVHGIPSESKILTEGDIIGLDFGVCYDGYYGDSAITIPIGEVSKTATELMDVTKSALMAGIERAYPGNNLLDISSAIQNFAEDRGFSVVRSFVGHGIGKKLHEDPQVPNFVPNNSGNFKGIQLKPGMVFAIEPMVNVGKPDIKILKDGWTAVTLDGSLSAHFEHTVVITNNGPEILTGVRH